MRTVNIAQGAQQWQSLFWGLAFGGILGYLATSCTIQSVNQLNPLVSSTRIVPVKDLHPGLPPERVLVCILASTRGSHVVWESFHTNFLSALVPGEPGAVDLALAVGEGENRTDNHFYEHAKYVWTYPEVEDWGTAFDEVQRQLGAKSDWRRLLDYGDIWMGGVKDSNGRQQGGSGGVLIFFRWFLLNKLREHGLLQQYDRFVVTRSDFMYVTRFPPLALLSPDYIWIPDSECWNGYPDRQVIASGDLLPHMLDIAENVVTQTDALYKNMSIHSKWNIEQTIRYHLEWKGLLPRVNMYPYIMYTTREESEEKRTRWVAAGQYHAEAGQIVKYMEEYRRSKWFAKKGMNDTWSWARFLASEYDPNGKYCDGRGLSWTGEESFDWRPKVET